MAKNQYGISLTSRQRRILRQIINSNTESPFKIRNARILLKTDSGKGGENQTDNAIAREFKLNVEAVERLQRRFIERGLDKAVNQRIQTKDIVINSAPDTGTLVDFGVGKVQVNPDGSTSVLYPGGSVNVTGGLNGKGLTFTDPTTGVNIFPGIADINFPGGFVTYDPDKGLVINYPGGSITYDQTNGLVVKYPGGGANYNLAKGGVVQFPGGEVNLAPVRETNLTALSSNVFNN